LSFISSGDIFPDMSNISNITQTTATSQIQTSKSSSPPLSPRSRKILKGRSHSVNTETRLGMLLLQVPIKFFKNVNFYAYFLFSVEIFTF
jgi:hypothetical protein